MGKGSAVQSVSVDADWVLITVRGVPDRPGIAAEIFHPIAAADINVNLILQSVSTRLLSDLSFTARSKDAESIIDLLNAEGLVSQGRVNVQGHVALVQVEGRGIRTDSTVMVSVFKALGEAAINIECIGTSAVKLTCVVDATEADHARLALQNAFGLYDVPSNRASL